MEELEELSDEYIEMGGLDLADDVVGGVILDRQTAGFVLRRQTIAADDLTYFIPHLCALKAAGLLPDSEKGRIREGIDTRLEFETISQEQYDAIMAIVGNIQ